MQYNVICRIYGSFYHSACMKKMKTGGIDRTTKNAIKKEYAAIVKRAKDIGKSKVLSAYLMAAYFIALNRNTDTSPQENYELFKDGLYDSKLFHLALGKADAYLDKKKLPGRMEWSRNSHRKQYENDWVVDVLAGNDEYDLGYNYLECGVCKLCRDEGCFELAKYLCQLDYVMADMMGMELKRTQTIAEGHSYCDFRYKKKG